jgi:hypothetical protein
MSSWAHPEQDFLRKALSSDLAVALFDLDTDGATANVFCGPQ